MGGGESLEANRITVVGGEVSWKQSVSVAAAYVGELRHLTNGLASCFDWDHPFRWG